MDLEKVAYAGKAHRAAIFTPQQGRGLKDCAGDDLSILCHGQELGSLADVYEVLARLLVRADSTFFSRAKLSGRLGAGNCV